MLSIAHLDDRERMFFVSLVLNELVSWMRLQRGTSTLRAMVYIDEMMGYLPPVAMPPSKPPLLTLLKQARAFGLGMTLATQNPSISITRRSPTPAPGFSGRLQTERDKARLLDGLEGAQAAAGHGFDRATSIACSPRCEKRTFLLHNVHEQEPVLFKTRWTLSYLRGPLGRRNCARSRRCAGCARCAGAIGASGASGAQVRRCDQVQRVRRGAAGAQCDACTGAPAPVAPGPRTRTRAPSAPSAPSAPRCTRPVLDPAIPQFFAPGEGSRWTPVLLGAARVNYADAKLGVDETRDVIVSRPSPTARWPSTGNTRNRRASTSTICPASLPTTRRFRALPAAAVDPREVPQWTKDFTQWVGRSQALELLKSAGAQARLASPMNRSATFASDCRRRCARSATGDDQSARSLRRRSSRRSTIAFAAPRPPSSAQQQQASESKLQTGVSVAATIFGAMLGRKAVSASTLGRATTTRAAWAASAASLETLNAPRPSSKPHRPGATTLARTLDERAAGDRRSLGRA